MGKEEKFKVGHKSWCGGSSHTDVKLVFSICSLGKPEGE